MEPHIIIGLILLLQVIIDGLGDGFRVRGWQIPHHSMESLRIAVWIGIWASTGFGWLDFQWYYIAMYILGRIWLFDPVINLVAQFGFFYVGTSSLDGILLNWIADKYKVPVILPAIMIKLMALAWWIAWLLTNGGR